MTEHHTGSPARRITLTEIIDTLTELERENDAVANEFSPRGAGRLAAQRAEVLGAAKGIILAVDAHYDRFREILGGGRSRFGYGGGRGRA